MSSPGLGELTELDAHLDDDDQPPEPPPALPRAPAELTRLDRCFDQHPER
jgi:hypothetical protein